MVIIFTISAIASPILILIGALLIRYADKNKIKTDPLIPLWKFASQITNDIPMDSIIRHDKLYYPHNKKMNWLFYFGVSLSFIGTCLAIYVGIYSLFIK